jgi:hypothetical protein
LFSKDFRTEISVLFIPLWSKLFLWNGVLFNLGSQTVKQGQNYCKPQETACSQVWLNHGSSVSLFVRIHANLLVWRGNRYLLATKMARFAQLTRFESLLQIE